MIHLFDRAMLAPLDNWTLIDDAEGGSNEQVLTLCLGANFYFADGHTPEKRKALAQCVNKLQDIYGEHLRWCIGTVGRTKRYKKTDAASHIVTASDRVQIGEVCGSLDPDSADEYRISYLARPVWDPQKACSELTVRLPAKAENLDVLRSIFVDFCRVLQPLQAMGGVLSATAWDSYSWQPQEYALSKHFFGVLVGVHEFLIRKMKSGIHSPTWLLALNPQWYARIGGDAGLAALNEPSVLAQHYSAGVILQAGSYPDPLPVEEGLPVFWRKYNAWLKPLRIPDIDCLHTAALDFEQQFDEVTTRMWYERMDEGAQWPPTAQGYEAKLKAMREEAEAKEAPPPAPEHQ
ncbi:hypothetical protein os1_21650 [Comamonadaceae bacterium OS-1]|nr:hypothetical protein os1_21650 [Comamonadaceae bacterium OS-1]